MECWLATPLSLSSKLNIVGVDEEVGSERDSLSSSSVVIVSPGHSVSSCRREITYLTILQYYNIIRY